MGRVKREAIRFFCPSIANGLVGCETFEGLQAPGEVIGADEVIEVGAQVIMVAVVDARDGGILDGAVHAFDLPVGPRVAWFREAMVDVVPGAGKLKAVDPEKLVGVEKTWSFRRRVVNRFSS